MDSKIVRKIIKWLLISIGGFFLLYLGYFIIIHTVLSLFLNSMFPSTGTNKQALIENFTKKEKEILELKSFFNSIVPKEYSVYIEFKNNEKIDLGVFDTYIKNSYGAGVTLFQQWNINPYNYKEEMPITYDSTEYYTSRTKSLNLVKQKLKWTDSTFSKIKKMLDNANCISISSGEPAAIGFARKGMGKYSYLIYDNAISDSLKAEYNKNNSCVPYNDKVILTFGGGAFTSDTFPDK